MRKVITSFFIVLFSLLSYSTVHADEAVGNHRMGDFIQAEEVQDSQAQTSEDSSAVARAKRSVVQFSDYAPDNLSSSDSSLPRKDAVDIASYQSWMNQADFNALKSAGVKTIVVKLTEHTTYTNPYAKSQIAMARAAGLRVAVYHFARFEIDNNPAGEAAYFAKQAKALGLPTSTVVIEDAESGYAGNWTSASQTFANTLKSAGYYNVRYYASASWINSGKINGNTLGVKNMWVAQYLYGKPSASDLRNTAYGAWQYSSQMYFQGTGNLRANPVDVSIDYKNIFSASIVPPTPPAGYNNVYRLYNTRSMEHLYTTDLNEAQTLVERTVDWTYEGVAWYSPKSASKSVFRVYNPKSGEHLYTTDNYEASVLTSKHGWKREGTAFYSGGGKAIYRLFNPAAGVGSHFVTASTNERDTLKKRGWKYEGIAWYAK
ncbi:GH25 family lysozyme [Lactococcus termiticola]|uniref:Lyzozyme M1 n=1 Tax=Lactococcus termiticola TaxID=2169526 RepID=A0A2R5HJ43_9LACT|nr:GH25 family lysozyme [Lactococcus termiticola]GBG96508.1 lyzozyme M1 [Lactococcus termiticola]